MIYREGHYYQCTRTTPDDSNWDTEGVMARMIGAGPQRCIEGGSGYASFELTSKCYVDPNYGGYSHWWWSNTDLIEVPKPCSSISFFRRDK